MDRAAVRGVVRILIRPGGRARVALAIVAVLGVAGCGEAAAPEANVLPANAVGGVDASGVVVWESNRSGSWRIWRAPLDGGEAQQLTPDEPGRRHCCPHIAPDGSRLVYLSLPEGRQRYLDDAAVGPLRWLALDGSDGGAVAERARTYFEHRAAVWVDRRRLRYIGEDRAVRTIDLEDGSQSVTLEASAEDPRRWLVDPTGRFAASGLAVLAPVGDRTLGDSIPLPGCQPYFTSDGRWAFWTAGAGGPIDRFDLATGEAATLVEKGDASLPVDRGYLYFPMVSHDRTLLAFAASGGEHDHYKADYDVFVAEIDPDTLERLSVPLPIAADPAVDRFPDVWRAPLVLGRTVGEVPLEVRFESPDGDSLDWQLGAHSASGGSLEATLSEPGVYRLEAKREGVRHAGVVVAHPVLSPARTSATWPVREDGLLWSWSPGRGATTPLDGEGAVTSGGTLDLGGGSLVAQESAALLHGGLDRTNRFTLEVDLEPGAGAGGSLAAILAIGRNAGRENLVLGARDGRLVMRLRVGPKADPYAEADLGPLARERSHLTVTYTPGRTIVYRDGVEVLRTTDLRGHFYHWRTYPLVLGDRWEGGARWAGTLHRVAVYDRLLGADEVAANARLSLGD